MAAAILAAAGCASAEPPPARSPIARAPIGWSGSTFLKLQHGGSVGGFTVTPTRVEEDSRCPMHVQCIQAGTVRLSVRIGGRARHVLTLKQPSRIAFGAWLTLCDVIPYPARAGRIRPADYRFGFVLHRAVAPPERATACPTPTVASDG
jgi:hypothetical protein